MKTTNDIEDQIRLYRQMEWRRKKQNKRAWLAAFKTAIMIVASVVIFRLIVQLAK